MKRSHPQSVATFLAVFLSVLVIAAFTPSMAFAGVEGISRGWNNFLDSVEAQAEKTPLKRLQNDIFEDFNILINPYFKAGMKFTDNVFYEPGTDRDEVVWTFTPGVTLTYLNSQFGRVSVNYEADFEYYTKFADENNTQDQSLSVAAEIYPMEDLYVNVTEELVQEGATGGTVGVKNVDYLDNTVKVTLGYQYEGWTPEVSYSNFQRRYASDIHDRFDYSDDTWQVRLYRQLRGDDGMRAYVGYDLGWLNYRHDPSRSTTHYEFLAGFIGTLPFGIHSNLQLGVHRRDLNIDRHDDFTLVTTSLSFDKDLTDKTSVTASFARRPVESSFDDQTMYDEKYWSVGMKHLFSDKVRARLNLNWGNRDFEETSIVGSAVGERDDSFFGLGLGLDYAAREWMILHLDYNLSRRDSNFNSFDATENALSLGMTMPL